MKVWSVCAEDATSYRSFVCRAAVTSLMPPSLRWDSTVPDSSEKNPQSACFSIQKSSRSSSVTTIISKSGLESSSICVLQLILATWKCQNPQIVCISSMLSFYTEKKRMHTQSKAWKFKIEQKTTHAFWGNICICILQLKVQYVKTGYLSNLYLTEQTYHQSNHWLLLPVAAICW